jgi:hypothetical protein
VTSATGTYYYLGVPTCRAFKEYGQWSNRRHSPRIAWMFDGFALYGDRDEYGEYPTDLDQCNGHVGAIPDNGYGQTHDG